MSGAAAKVSGRRMEYPYTLSAKVANFPWKFYFTKHWVWKTLPFGIGLSTIMMYKIQRGTNTPENKAKWREIRRKDRIGHFDEDH